MDQYEFPITDSGYFIAYKSVKKTEKTYKAVNMWVPKEYIQLKASGKDPKDYTVVDKRGDFSIVETSLITDDKGNFIAPDHVAGNLQVTVDEFVPSDTPDGVNLTSPTYSPISQL